MASWRTQDANRQAHRRDVNEAMPCAGNFVCECGDPACSRIICLSSAEYENVRAYPNHFAIATNHENPDVEAVVNENIRFAVVATIVGEASKIALRTDPRGLYAHA